MNKQHFKHQEVYDGFAVNYNLYCPAPTSQGEDAFDENMRAFLADYEGAIAEIETLTNHADGWDYALAVSSGIIAGLIDSFFVGEWDFKQAKAISNQDINEQIQKFAKEHGLERWVEEKNAKARTRTYDANRLEIAVEFLEEKFPLPGDNTWSGSGKKISTKTHHLDDFKHHPTVVGLICNIANQFKKVSTYHNRDGEVIKLLLSVDKNGLLEGKTPAAKISAGVINWCINVAKNWKGHLYSDMAGSKQTVGEGMGLPGSILSTLRELAALPGLQDAEFTTKLYKAYVNGIGSGPNQLDLEAFNVLFEGASNRFDLRTENAIKGELKRQSIPVIINEVVVRSFYFVRHLSLELKGKGDLELVEWKKILPFKNRTVVRMLTISTGTFTVIDMADAAIRFAVKSGGNSAAFAGNFILRVNFVGVGRFAIAFSTDLMMGIKKSNWS